MFAPPAGAGTQRIAFRGEMGTGLFPMPDNS
jgi:hypothetical protein